MISEVYDEITRNNIEMDAIIREKYETEITAQDLVNEIAQLNKTIFVPGVLCKRFQVTPQQLIESVHEASMVSATIKTAYNNHVVFLGIVVAPTTELLQETVKLYNAVCAEANLYTKH